MTETDHLFIADILSVPLLSTLRVQLWAVIKSGEVAQSRHLLSCILSLLKMLIIVPLTADPKYSSEPNCRLAELGTPLCFTMSSDSPPNVQSVWESLADYASVDE